MSGLSWEIERTRVTSGTCSDAPPPGLDVFRIHVNAPSSAGAVLQRAREVMASVVRSPTEPWPTDEQWLTILPAWFVEVSLAETAAGLPPLPAESDGADVERWSVDAFVHWFEPSEREWWWWGIESESEDTLTVCLVVQEFTVFHAALDWLLYASGAAAVEDENLRELREARDS